MWFRFELDLSFSLKKSFMIGLDVFFWNSTLNQNIYDDLRASHASGFAARRSNIWKLAHFHKEQLKNKTKECSCLENNNVLGSNVQCFYCTVTLLGTNGYWLTWYGMYDHKDVMTLSITCPATILAFFSVWLALLQKFVNMVMLVGLKHGLLQIFWGDRIDLSCPSCGCCHP